MHKDIYKAKNDDAFLLLLVESHHILVSFYINPSSAQQFPFDSYYSMIAVNLNACYVLGYGTPKIIDHFIRHSSEIVPTTKTRRNH